MNRFTPLLKNQSLTLDNHHPSLPLEWGKGLHIDKRFRGEERRRFSIRFPIDKDLAVSISPKNVAQSDEVFNEIKKAFVNDNTRKRFAKEIYAVIEEFNNKDLSIAELRIIAKRIAYNFGISEQIVSEIVELHDQKIRRYSSLHSDKETKSNYEVTQIRGKIRVKESKTLFGSQFKQPWQYK